MRMGTKVGVTPLMAGGCSRECEQHLEAGKGKGRVVP